MTVLPEATPRKKESAGLDGRWTGTLENVIRRGGSVEKTATIRYDIRIQGTTVTIGSRGATLRYETGVLKGKTLELPAQAGEAQRFEAAKGGLSLRSTSGLGEKSIEFTPGSGDTMRMKFLRKRTSNGAVDEIEESNGLLHRAR